MKPYAFVSCAFVVLSVSNLSGEEIPRAVQDIVSNRCLECHDALSEKGEINLEQTSIDWNNIQELDMWLRALDAVDGGLMPPPEETQLSETERETVIAFLENFVVEESDHRFAFCF